MWRPRLSLLLVLLTLVTTACSSSVAPSERAPAGGAPQAAPAPAPNRTLVMVAKLEPVGLATKLLNGTNNTRSARRLVNASVTVNDDKGQPRPYLIESLPQLGSDAWRMLPDGRMEVTYVLRPGLTWHDGTPLTVADFAFAWRVYLDPGTKALFGPSPEDLMDEPIAIDDRTMLIRWKTLYPDAGGLSGSGGTDDFAPLPRHLLESQFLQDKGDPFVNLPYWNQSYVGTGPYRLDRWEPGTFMELSAFDGHAGGRPKMDRILFKWIEDPNTVLANLLAGEAHIAVNDAIRFQQGTALKQAWSTPDKGNVLVNAREARFVQIQFSPQFNNPKALLDVRVRKALAHSIDRQALVDGLLNGEGQTADTLMSPQMPYYQELLNTVPKYPYDLRAAEQQFNESGLTKGAGGFYTSAGGERFNPELRAFGGGQEESELLIMVDQLKRTGIDVTPNVIPAVYSRDVQIRAQFPALTANVTQLAERTVFNKLESFNIPTAENRWVGFNRGAWANADFDRLEGVFNSTMERPSRDQTVMQMMKIVADDVGVIPMYYNLDAVGFVGSLAGPTISAPDTTRDWNIQDWRWTQ